MTAVKRRRTIVLLRFAGVAALLALAAEAARLKEVVPALLALSKCPDFVTDRGHLFGTGLSDDDKRALMAYVKRL